VVLVSLRFLWIENSESQIEISVEPDSARRLVEGVRKVSNLLVVVAGRIRST
jgi:hypothetical protein